MFCPYGIHQSALDKNTYTHSKRGVIQYYTKFSGCKTKFDLGSTTCASASKSSPYTYQILNFNHEPNTHLKHPIVTNVLTLTSMTKRSPEQMFQSKCETLLIYHIWFEPWVVLQKLSSRTVLCNQHIYYRSNFEAEPEKNKEILLHPFIGEAEESNESIYGTAGETDGLWSQNVK